MPGMGMECTGDENGMRIECTGDEDGMCWDGNGMYRRWG